MYNAGIRVTAALSECTSKLGSKAGAHATLVRVAQFPRTMFSKTRNSQRVAQPSALLQSLPEVLKPRVIGPVVGLRTWGPVPLSLPQRLGERCSLLQWARPVVRTLKECPAR